MHAVQKNLSGWIVFPIQICYVRMNSVSILELSFTCNLGYQKLDIMIFADLPFSELQKRLQKNV